MTGGAEKEGIPASFPSEAEYRRLRRQNTYLGALHETAVKLLERLEEEELLEAILQRAAEMTGTEHGFIYLLDEDGQRMRMRVVRGFFSTQLGLQVKLGEGLGGKVWQCEGPVIVDRYRDWQGRLPDSSLDPLLSVVGIPLKSDAGVLGVIGLGSVASGKRFDEEDVIVLSRFAALALMALDKARLYADVRRELAERRKAEAILRKSEERYKSLLESSPDPVVVYDMEGRANYVNPAFEQTFGMSRQDLLGKKIDFVPAEDWPDTERAIERMLAGQKIQNFETRRRTKDGRVLDVQLSSTLYMDREGIPEGNIVILRDVTAAKKVEQELKQYRHHLEDLVQERTAALGKEVEERRRVTEALRKRERELKAQSQHLEEVNTALKVLLQQREQDRKELAGHVVANVKELVMPYVHRIAKTRLTTGQRTLLQILESNLDNIISPFVRRVGSRYLKLTPMEIQVANLVREGKTNKEIADLLCLSKNTILFHRQNVRRKLGLKNKKVNLRTHLLSFEE
jgi:PAS domain S-box-containing protein